MTKNTKFEVVHASANINSTQSKLTIFLTFLLIFVCTSPLVIAKYIKSYGEEAIFRECGLETSENGEYIVLHTNTPNCRSGMVFGDLTVFNFKNKKQLFKIDGTYDYYTVFFRNNTLYVLHIGGEFIGYDMLGQQVFYQDYNRDFSNKIYLSPYKNCLVIIGGRWADTYEVVAINISTGQLSNNLNPYKETVANMVIFNDHGINLRDSRGHSSMQIDLPYCNKFQ